MTEVYLEWRRVFDDYDPPRFAVAEAVVLPERRARYAAPTGLGQAFNFSMQEAAWDLDEYRAVIDSGLADMRATGSSTTWLLGCHDSIRVATRYGLPRVTGRSSHDLAQAWLISGGREPILDAEAGRWRARAALLVLLALPGSTYIYQGDELSLPEVADLPQEVLQDPVAFRSGGRQKGRDGCRVPLPWNAVGPSLGFGPAAAHLPQPTSFAAYAADVQSADPTSSLSLFRSALGWRRRLIPAAGSDLAWCADSPGVLHVERPGGWHCVANFGSAPCDLPDGEVLVASEPLGPAAASGGARLGPDSAAWVRVDV